MSGLEVTWLAEWAKYLDAEATKSQAGSEAWRAIFAAIPEARRPLEKWDSEYKAKHQYRPPTPARAQPEGASRPGVLGPSSGIPVPLTSVVGNQVVDVTLSGYEHVATVDGVREPNWVGWADPYTRVSLNTADGNPLKGYTALSYNWDFVPPSPGTYHIYRNSPDPHLAFTALLQQNWPHEWCNVLLGVGWAYGVRGANDDRFTTIGEGRSHLLFAKRDAWTHDGPRVSYDSYPIFLPDWTDALVLPAGAVARYSAGAVVIWACGNGGNVWWDITSFNIGASPDQLLMAVPW